MPNLTSLILSRNKIGDESAIPLFNALIKTNIRKDFTLSLANNHLTDKALDSILSLVEQKQIKSLNLTFNLIKSRDFKCKKRLE